jgi:predicted short-subunit dehydrogenase-like oxidoreductase (DUF2520 family)
VSDRLRVGIVGAGRVGPVIGAALAGAGHAIVSITSGSDDDRVAAILPGVPLRDPQDVVRESQLVVIAVPHDQLEGLVTGLAELDAWQPGQLVMHTDPAFGTDVLAPALARGVIPLAIHPATVLPIAQALAVELGCEPVIIAESDRAAYAEGVTTATDFSRSIIRQATDLLRSAGVAEPGRYLAALMHTTVDHALVEAGTDDIRPPVD